jgi:hypothetical protein|tara:strand:- start:75 stop:338 length:264 start_codon:yes stop_codon:yes gene_type:complete
MHILDYNTFVETMHCQKRRRQRCDGACVGKKQDAQTSLRDGFNTYAVTLPNGCTVRMNENGEVHIAEKDAPFKKLRNADKIQQHLVN